MNEYAVTLHNPDPDYWPTPEELAAYEQEDEIVTLDQFIGAVAAGAYTADDGHGYAGDGVNFWPEHIVTPGMSMSDVPPNATHVKWFNK